MNRNETVLIRTKDCWKQIRRNFHQINGNWSCIALIQSETGVISLILIARYDTKWKLLTPFFHQEKKSKGEDMFASFQDWNNNNNNSTMIRRAPSKPPPPFCRDSYSIGALQVREEWDSFLQFIQKKEKLTLITSKFIGIINFFPFITETRLHPHVYAPSDDTGTNRSVQGWRFVAL